MTVESAARPKFQRYVAIGDSFTEGVGDERPDGSPRGWADLVAPIVAERSANLAVRGKLLGSIVDDQLEAALVLQPDVVSLAGGGNDVLRPRSDVPALARLLDLTVARLTDAGATVFLFTAADPCDQLPLGRHIRAKGDRFADAVRTVARRRGATLVDLWALRELRRPGYWSADRLHLGPAGHRRVAVEVVDALGFAAPLQWIAPAAQIEAAPGGPVEALPAGQSWAGQSGTVQPGSRSAVRQLDYYRRHVGPWVYRRVTGRSSGDGRPAKRPELTELREPEGRTELGQP